MNIKIVSLLTSTSKVEVDVRRGFVVAAPHFSYSDLRIKEIGLGTVFEGILFVLF